MSTTPDDDDDRTLIRPVVAGAAASSPSSSSSSASGFESTRREPAQAQAQAEDDSLALPAGTLLAEFELIEKIGEGGFSIVYLAHDQSLGRKVALKEYMPSSIAGRKAQTQVSPRSERHRDTFEAGLKSFINEAKLLAHFDHGSLVKVYRFWEANGTAYMVMPLYEGLTLRDTVRAMPQPPDEAWLMRVLAPLTEALTVIHADQCYHRDIAPDNVILLAGSRKPLLLDFGAARRVIGDMTQALTVILKPGYAPVEQYAELPDMKQGPWTDVYALAATVYWCITGKTPPPAVGRMLGDTYQPLAQIAQGRYSDAFLQAIDRALVVRPEARTQTMELLRQDMGLLPSAPHGHDDPERTIAPAARAPTVTTRPEPTFQPTEQATVAQPRTAVPAETSTPTPTSTSTLTPPPTATHGGAHPAAQSPSPVKPAPAAVQSGPPWVWAGGLVAALALAAGAWLWWQRASAPQPVPASTGAVPVVAPVPVPVPPPVATPVAQPEPVPTAASAAAPAASVAPVAAERPVASAASLAASSASSSTTSPTPAPPRAPRPPRDAAPPAQAPAPAASKVAKPARKAGASPECASILQAVSLGDASPEMLQRLKTLNCP